MTSHPFPTVLTLDLAGHPTPCRLLWRGLLGAALLGRLAALPVTAGEEPARLLMAPIVQAAPAREAIVHTLETYFQATATQDGTLLDRVLHPDARAWNNDAGELDHKGWTEFFTSIRSPKKGPAHPHPTPQRIVTQLTQVGGMATVLVEQQRPSSHGPIPLMTYAFQLMKPGKTWTIVGFTTHMNRHEGHTEARTLDVMGLQPGMTVGEIGAGSGRVTLALAERVGPSGRVISNDIRPKALEALQERCKRRGFKQVETVLGKVGDACMPPRSLDRALLVWVYHHLDQPVALLRNLIPALKPGAQVVILDPSYERTDEKDSDRPTTRERVLKEAAEAGFELVRMETFLPQDDLYILKLKDAPPRS